MVPVRRHDYYCPVPLHLRLGIRHRRHFRPHHLHFLTNQPPSFCRSGGSVNDSWTPAWDEFCKGLHNQPMILTVGHASNSDRSKRGNRGVLYRQIQYFSLKEVVHPNFKVNGKRSADGCIFWPHQSSFCRPLSRGEHAVLNECRGVAESAHGIRLCDRPGVQVCCIGCITSCDTLK